LTPMFGENRRLVYCEPVPLGKITGWIPKVSAKNQLEF
jgi:hypothetical protein